MKTNTSMQLGMVGLGRMGANMVRRLMKCAHDCVVYDRNAETVDALANEGATGASSLDGALLDGALRGSSDNASARTGEM